jgi:hypothetical protein
MVIDKLFKTTLLIAGLSIAGCAERKQSIVSELDEESNEQIAFNEYVEDVSVLPIIETDSLLIGDMSKIEMVDESTYIIYDKMQKALLKVTKDGAIVDMFRQVGRGPDDYLEINDFDVDVDNGRLFLLCDRMPSKIIVMDFDFNIKQSVKLANIADNYAYERIVYYDNSWYVYSHGAYSIYKLNENFEAVEFIKSARSGMGIHLSPQLVFHKTKDALLANMISDDVIYAIKDGGWKPFFTLNWSDKEERYEKLTNIVPGDNVEYALNTPPTIYTLFIDGNRLLIIYSKFLFRMAEIDLKTGEIVNSGIISNTIDGTPYKYADGDPSDFLFMGDSLSNQKLYNTDIQIAKETPILIRYKLK